jgi:hypothetical protein
MCENCRRRGRREWAHRAALSYSSKRGMARSFIFLGTASTSGGESERKRHRREEGGHTLFRHLHYEKLFTFLRLGYVRGDERVLVMEALVGGHKEKNW